MSCQAGPGSSKSESRSCFESRFCRAGPGRPDVTHPSYLVSSKGTFFNLAQLQYQKSATTIPTLQGYFSKRKLALQKQEVNLSYNNRDLKA
jgi:hypothetical protein